jgi:6-pyruvoyltetrahydropterin/6-carboxytetrahydropterin synthase
VPRVTPATTSGDSAGTIVTMIHLTREVRFSIDRDWAGRVAFDRPVTNSWGGWPSAVGLVPYLRLRATVAGEPDPRTGYLCNISVLDDLLRRQAIPYTAEVLRRHGWRMSAERLLVDLWGQVRGQVRAPVLLARLELLVTPTLCYAIERKDPEMVRLTQQFEFSAAHRLHCPQLSDEENRRTFGKCNNPHGHGHNYLVEVTVAGVPSDQSGALLALPAFEQIVKEQAIDRLDHRHLNEDVPEFRDLNPSVENIARVIWAMLDPHVAPARLHSVRVWETPKTWAEYAGP